MKTGAGDYHHWFDDPLCPPSDFNFEFQSKYKSQHDQISAKYTLSQNTVLSSVMYFGWACLVFKHQEYTSCNIKQSNVLIILFTEIGRTRNITSSYCHLKLELRPDLRLRVWWRSDNHPTGLSSQDLTRSVLESHSSLPGPGRSTQPLIGIFAISDQLNWPQNIQIQ